MANSSTTLGKLRDSKAQEWGFANDFEVRKRIEFAIIPARATIIQRRYDNTKIFPQTLIQTVKCKKVIQVPEIECCSGATGYKTVRTLNKVPRPLIVKDESYFTYVGSANLFDSFTYVPPSDLKLARHRKFTDKAIHYTYMDGYVYILNASALHNLAVRAVFENPLAVRDFGECVDDACFLDGDLEIEESLVEGINGLLEIRRPKIITGEESEIKVNDNNN